MRPPGGSLKRWLPGRTGRRVIGCLAGPARPGQRRSYRSVNNDLTAPVCQGYLDAMSEDAADLASLARRIADLARGLAGTGEWPAGMPVLTPLRLAVARARASGHTWQEIGDVLGVSRQAAFQRFGRPVDPRTGEVMTPVITDAADRAIAVLADWFEGRYDAVTATFDERMARELPPDKMSAAWAQLIGIAGEYQGMGAGEPLVRQLGDYTVADIPLEFEAGEMKGRVSFDRDGKVSGLFVLPPQVP